MYQETSFIFTCEIFYQGFNIILCSFPHVFVNFNLFPCSHEILHTGIAEHDKAIASLDNKVSRK